MTVQRIALIVVAAAIAGAAAGTVWARSQPERYETVLVAAVGPSTSLTEQADVIDVVATLDRGGITATAAGLATSTAVRDAAAARVQFAPGVAAEYEVDALPVTSSSLVDITVSGPEPDSTADFANAIGFELQREFEAIYGVYRIELITPAQEPPSSSRPSPLLVGLLGATVAALGTLATAWAAFGGRWNARRAQRA